MGLTGCLVAPEIRAKPLMLVQNTDAGYLAALNGCWFETEVSEDLTCFFDGEMARPTVLPTGPVRKPFAKYRVAGARFYAQPQSSNEAWPWSQRHAFDCAIRFADSNTVHFSECSGSVAATTFHRENDVINSGGVV